MADLDRSRGESVVPNLRITRQRGSEQRVTFFELFFDLVYVFAVTQVSHHLLATGVSWEGAAESGLMLVALYWAWNYTTWMANWFDPSTVPVRLALIFVMLASLLMAVAIPEAFGDRALLLACSYVALQVGRNAFVVAVTPSGTFNHNFRRILAWTVLSAPLWVAGGLADDLRWPLWAAALAVDLAAPLLRYWLPGFGGTPMSQWEIEGHHFGERFQLFVIIALGESIVLAGVTASGTDLTAGVVVALCLAFLGSVTLWWLYFGGVANVIAALLDSRSADEMGLIGRDIYTYLHLPIVVGIVLTAVGDELVIGHPGHDLGVAGAVVTMGGPALYLIGLIACVVRMGERVSRAYVAATALLIASMPIAAALPGLAAIGWVVVVLVTLAVIEQAAANRAAKSNP